LSGIPKLPLFFYANHKKYLLLYSAALEQKKIATFMA